MLANYAIELVTDKLNGFKGRKTFLISWVYGAANFLFFSITFFWFINFQLFKINQSNFIYNGTMPVFDFLYYTLKTITFGDIELVKPISMLARISEVASFFTIGIFLLIIFVSVFLSIHQEKMKENVKTTTEFFNSENNNLAIYFQAEFGMEIKSALSEIKNIDESIKNLKKIIDKLF